MKNYGSKYVKLNRKICRIEALGQSLRLIQILFSNSHFISAFSCVLMHALTLFDKKEIVFLPHFFDPNGIIHQIAISTHIQIWLRRSHSAVRTLIFELWVYEAEFKRLVKRTRKRWSFQTKALILVDRKRFCCFWNYFEIMKEDTSRTSVRNATRTKGVQLMRSIKRSFVLLLRFLLFEFARRLWSDRS